MRILIVTNAYPTAASPESGVFVAEQVRGLEARDIEMRVLHVDRLTGGMGAYRGLRARLGRELEQTRPDLVHVRYGGVLAGITTRAVRDRPVLVTFCGSDLLGSPAEPPLRRLTIGYGVRVSRRAAVRAAGVVLVAPNLCAALPRRVPRERIWIVPDPVDLARFTPLDAATCRERLGWDSARRHVLFPSDPTRVEKRFALARAAVDRLAAGGAPVELHVLTGVPHEEVPVWLNASDAVVLTSTHEGSPNALKEALACNVPVVSVGVGTARAMLDGIDGCYVAEATPEDVSARLASVLERGGRVQARTTMEQVSLAKTSEQMAEIYGALLGQAPHGPRD